MNNTAAVIEHKCVAYEMHLKLVSNDVQILKFNTICFGVAFDFFYWATKKETILILYPCQNDGKFKVPAVTFQINGQPHMKCSSDSCAKMVL